MSYTMKTRRHELYREVEEHICIIFEEHGIEKLTAKQIGTNVVNHLAEHWGGQMISFPKDSFYKLAERDLAIYNDFKGNNWGELIRKYDMSESGLRRIIQRVKKRSATQK